MGIKEPVIRLAFSDRNQRIARKSFFVILAALACYGLYYVENLKNRFDEMKARPVFIDQDFKKQLGNEVSKPEVGGGSEAWKDIEKFIPVSQYTTQEQFINNITAQISRAADAKEFVARAEFNTCIGRATALVNSAEASKPGGTETTANPDPQQSKPSQPKDCSDNYIAASRESYAEAQNKIAEAYRYLKPISLSGVKNQIHKGSAERKLFIEASLQPVLDDNSGLHVIYQVLRISFVVFIIFTLITSIGLMMRALLPAEGVKTLTEYGKSLIGDGKSAVLSNAARTAVISVAALGVGVAGVAINNKADLALAQHRDEVYGAGGSKSGPQRPTNSSGRSMVAHFDNANTQYDYRNFDPYFNNSQDNHSDNSQDNRRYENPPAAAPVVKLYPRFSIPGGTSKTEFSLSDSQMTAMTNYFTSLKTANEGLTQAATNLSNRLAAFKPNPDDIKVSNHVEAQADKPLLIDFRDTKSAFSAPLQSLLEKVGAIDKLNKSLADLELGNLDKPAKRSFLTRLFAGPDRYFVSKRAAERVKELLKENDALLTGSSLKADAAISQTMDELYLRAGTPLNEKEFFKRIEAVLHEVVKNENDLKITLKRLETWRDSILTYTRVK